MGATLDHDQIRILVSRVENQLKSLNMTLLALTEWGVDYHISWADYKPTEGSDFYHRVVVSNFSKTEKF